MDELARVIAKAIRIIGRCIVGLLIISVIAGIGFGARHYYWEWQKNKIEITAGILDACLEMPYIISVKIKNNSSYSTEYIRFNIEKYRTRHSNNLLKYKSYSTDRIIEPGSVYESCLAIPEFKPEYKDVGEMFERITERDAEGNLGLPLQGRTDWESRIDFPVNTIRIRFK